MALNTLPAGAFADDAITSDKINLANTFAFTGTVTGTPQGLTLINSTSSTSTVASFNIDNVFSATYKFYRVYMRVEYSTTDGFFTRMIDSSGSTRASNYYYNDLSMYNNATSALYAGNNVSTWYNGRFSGGDVAGGGNRGGHYVIDFYDPFSASITHIFHHYMGYHDTANFYYGGSFVGFNSNAESHRGFTVIGNSSNIMQHDVKVYGVINA